jgi:phosphoglycerate kinase
MYKKYMPSLLSLEKFSKKNKTVLVRIDSDVDIKSGKIIDDTRLLSSIQSIKKLLRLNSSIILLGHLGRPERHDIEETLLPVAQWYGKFLNLPVHDIASPFGGWQIGKTIRLHENLRFFMEEEQNDEEFVKTLIEGADIYVNEAFAVSHRAHASIVGIPKYLPSYAGIHFMKEVQEMEKVLSNPKRPLAILIGGAKIETKLPMVEKMHEVADYVLVGGEVASHTKELIKIQHHTHPNRRSMVFVSDLIDSGLDITPQSTENFIQVIKSAKTIVWNGPLGQTGKNPLTELSTRAIAKAIADSHAYSIIGGGDTVSYLRQHKMLDKYDFVSVGGGAMLEYLSGAELPGIKALLR